MIALKGTGALIRINTSSTADIEIHVSAAKHDYTTPGPTTETFRSFPTNTAISSIVTGTTICAASGSATVDINVHMISIRNKHASTANTVTVEHYDGTLAVQLSVCTLAAGEAMKIDENGVLFKYDVNCGVVGGATAASDTVQGIAAIAVQSDQETATSLTTIVSPGRQHFHPSAAKFWVQVTGGGTPAISSSYNTTSVADTNTGRMTITIATDFSSANWCCVGMGMGSTAVSSAAIQWGVSKAAGTIEIDSSDLSATPVVEDPTVGYDVAGFGDL